MSFEKETVTPPSYDRWIDRETGTVARMDGAFVSIEYRSLYGTSVVVPIDAAPAISAALTALVPSIPEPELPGEMPNGAATLDTTEGVTHG